MSNSPRVFFTIFTTLCLFSFTADAFAFRSGPPGARNGSTASAGLSCTFCHGSTAGSGMVEIIGAPAIYQPNVIYDLLIRISDPNQAGAGFQISVESGLGAHVGSLILDDPTNTQFNFVAGWVNHTGTGVNNAVANWAGLGNAAEYTVQWQAPAIDVGAVTFWVAGNAINNDFSSFGDRIYLTNQTATAAVGVGACCDDGGSGCVEGRTQADCEGGGFRYGGDNSTCATIDPVCVSVTGACCDGFSGVCTDDVTQSDCQIAGSGYGGDASTCATLDPVCEESPIPIHLELVAEGLAAPLGVTHAGDGSGNLFIVDQSGVIRVVDAGGSLLATPFLDLTDRMISIGIDFGGGFVFDERGLLGLAFHPDYANNGLFYVVYSAPRASTGSEPCDLFAPDPNCHKQVVSEFQVFCPTPTGCQIANSSTERIILTVDQPQFNHNAGDIAFGPNGLLYIPLGDGGGGNDGLADDPPSHGPIGHGQNIETLLGSILRVDISGDDFPADPDRNYKIPSLNPFYGVTGADEIYAYGLRNPYRISFDDGPGGNGSLYVGDVGQALFEEVDIVEKGGNYGWVIREGANCFNPFDPGNPPAVCDTTGPLGEPLIDPVSEYTHAEGGISVIGGFVYRGSSYPALQGRYVYGDFSADFGPNGRLYYFDTAGPNQYERKEFFITPNGDPLGLMVKGFGEDQSGELYLSASTDLAPSGTSGKVFRLVAPPEPPVAVSSYQRALGMSLPASSAGTDTAYRMTLVSLYHPDDPQPVDQPDFSGSEGEVRYLNLLRDGDGNAVTECVSSSAFNTTYPCVSVGCEPEFADWATLFGGAPVYVSANAIIPDSGYTVAHLAASCAGNEANCANASVEVPFATARHGDTEPSGSVNVTDIVNTVDVVKQLPTALLEFHVYIRSENPAPHLDATNVTDIVVHVDALKLVSYALPLNSCP